LHSYCRFYPGLQYLVGYPVVHPTGLDLAGFDLVGPETVLADLGPAVADLGIAVADLGIAYTFEEPHLTGFSS
jgi:hypothetical protein